MERCSEAVRRRGAAPMAGAMHGVHKAEPGKPYEYMAALMAAPMVVIEILLMSGMFRDRKKNAVIVVISIVIGILAWVAIRQQAAIGNAQFLRSMIPHHAGAILMCEKLRADDAEIRELCAGIIASQEQEIAQMRRQLERAQ